MGNVYNKRELIEMGYGAYLKDRKDKFNEGSSVKEVSEMAVIMEGDRYDADKQYDYECDTDEYQNQCRIEDSN